METVTRSGLFGPWDAPDLGVDAMPPGVNPGEQEAVGPRLVPALAELRDPDLGAAAGTSRTTTGRRRYNTHVFEGNLYFVPAKNAA